MSKEQLDDVWQEIYQPFENRKHLYFFVDARAEEIVRQARTLKALPPLTVQLLIRALEDCCEFFKEHEGENLQQAWVLLAREELTARKH